ncbi:MAG: MFS transporter [Actinomycetota bacterium]
MSRHRGYLALLRRNRNFRLLLTGQLISFGGDWFSTVALLGLVIELTGSELLAALVLTASRLPFFLLSPIGGVVADRLNRKRLMIAADLIRAAIALGLLAVRSEQTVWLGLVSVAGLTAFSALFTPASQAALPNLVSDDDLPAANVLMGSAFGTMLAVGSALGGLVAATLGRDTAFVINAVSFLVSAALVLAIRAPFEEGRGQAARANPLHDLREGFAYARSDRRILALLATKGGFGLGGGVIALLSIFAVTVYRAGDLGIGLLFAARGLGALLGPIGAGAYVRDSQRRMFLAIGASMGLFGLAYLVFPRMPSLWLAAPVVTLAHLGGGAQWVLSSYGLQRLTPDRVRGRILSFDFGIVTLTISLSQIVAGRAAEVIDPRTVMVGLGLVSLAYAAVWTLATRSIWAGPSPPGLGAERPAAEEVPEATVAREG